MDTTEIYIKMSDCPEIQGIWQDADMSIMPSFVYDSITERVSIAFWAPTVLGDKIRHFYPDQGNLMIVSTEWDKEKYQDVPPDKRLEWHHKTIWLPRQDQLQEMVKENFVGVFSQFCWFRNWFEDGKQWETFTSMEQLWLAFVMSQRFSKVWSGDRWADA